MPGVFANNPYQYAINGSLWTLKYELICYIIIALFGFLGLLKKRFLISSILLSVILTSLMSIYNLHESGILYTLYYLCHFYIFFGGGSCYYIFRKHIILDYRLFFIFSILILIVSTTPLFYLAIAVFGSYLIFYLSFIVIPSLNNFARYGDFSYGMYIYAFPVQQTISFLFASNRHWLFNISLATPIILLCAACSWHLIEKKALSLKPG